MLIVIGNEVYDAPPHWARALIHDGIAEKLDPIPLNRGMFLSYLSLNRLTFIDEDNSGNIRVYDSHKNVIYEFSDDATFEYPLDSPDLIIDEEDASVAWTDEPTGMAKVISDYGDIEAMLTEYIDAPYEFVGWAKDGVYVRINGEELVKIVLNA